LENPFDYKLIQLSEYISTFLYNIKIIKILPNHITIFGIFISIISIYALYKNYYWVSAFLLLFRHFLDCLDGYYARKYKLESKTGDLLDHISDILTYISFTTLIVYKLKKDKRIFAILLIVLMFLISFTQLACQEKIYNNSADHNNSLRLLLPLCINTDLIKFTKYLANGSSIIIMVLFILYLKYYNK
jgi:phosphatidylglycerophosphate synthase